MLARRIPNTSTSFTVARRSLGAQRNIWTMPPKLQSSLTSAISVAGKGQLTLDIGRKVRDNFKPLVRDVVLAADSVATPDVQVANLLPAAGHGYSFTNRAMDGLSLQDRVELPFLNLLGKPPIAVTSDATGRRLKFPTGDEIFAANELQWSVDTPEFQAYLRIALTTGNHALAGFLIHCAAQIPGKLPFMLRIGGGQYPVPLMSKLLVDPLNVYVGVDLWPFTDQIVDYKLNKKANPEVFGKFYGADTRTRVETIVIPGSSVLKTTWALGRSNLPSGGIVPRVLQKVLFGNPPLESGVGSGSVPIEAVDLSAESEIHRQQKQVKRKQLKITENKS